MVARIYRPAKPATQSGRANTLHWVLEWEPAAARRADPLMGWIGSDDTQQQVRLTFPTKAAAVAYARRKALQYRVLEPHLRVVRPKSYAENFVRRV